MKRLLSKFGLGLRLLAVFGIGAVGVSAALPRGPAPAPEPSRQPSIQIARVAPAPVPATEPTRTAAVQLSPDIPWPWLDDLSQVELSEALLQDLSRGEMTIPQSPRSGFATKPATEPAPLADPLLANNQALPDGVTADVDDQDPLPHATAYAEVSRPAASGPKVVSVIKAELIASAAASGY